MARQLYETAFDSKVRQEAEEIDKLAQSPVLSEISRRRHSSGPKSGSAPSSTSGSSSNTPTHQPYVLMREGHCQALPQFLHAGKKKVTLIRHNSSSSPSVSCHRRTGSPNLSLYIKGEDFELKNRGTRYASDSSFLDKTTWTKSYNNECLLPANVISQRKAIENKLGSGQKNNGLKPLNFQKEKSVLFPTFSGSLDRRILKTAKKNQTSALSVVNNALNNNHSLNEVVTLTSMRFDNKNTEDQNKMIKNFSEDLDSSKLLNLSEQIKVFSSNFDKDSSTVSPKEPLNNTKLFPTYKRINMMNGQEVTKQLSNLASKSCGNSHLLTVSQTVSEIYSPISVNCQNSKSSQDQRLLWNVSELKLKSEGSEPLKENTVVDENNQIKVGESYKQSRKVENLLKNDANFTNLRRKEDIEKNSLDKSTGFQEKSITRPKRPGSLPIPSLATVSPPVAVKGQQNQAPKASSTQNDKDNICSKPPTSKASGAPTRPTLNLSLNLNTANAPKRARQQLCFSFGCPVFSAVGETVDPNIPLERQGWYHGSINRTDAEKHLTSLKEGSYLVRNSSRGRFALSLKSAKGFIHMKIVCNDEKFILGQFGKPFDSVPEMVHYYSVNKLPIRGAEHLSLLHPVIDQLL
ncbi:uncharacterized protein LOC143239733 [Tachypleus tridentatus]|uniref:uncharacterized protein LOC143239733 n=1 Tax=Tachypleus tridentatus TaxID=6853 RepID=UPI003FD53478